MIKIDLNRCLQKLKVSPFGHRAHIKIIIIVIIVEAIVIIIKL